MTHVIGIRRIRMRKDQPQWRVSGQTGKHLQKWLLGTAPSCRSSIDMSSALDSTTLPTLDTEDSISICNQSRLSTSMRKAV